jgi:hypothetical protein
MQAIEQRLVLIHPPSFQAGRNHKLLAYDIRFFLLVEESDVNSGSRLSI